MISAEALYHEALEANKASRFKEAAEKLQALIVSHPQFEDAYEALSVILFNQKQFNDSIAALQKWILINPDAVMARTNLSRCYAAKGLILEAEREQAEARRLSWKAELKTKKMEMPKVDFTAQIERFKKVIAFDPSDVLGYYSLGNAYLDAGQKREALETFQKAIEVGPNHSSSFLGLGMALEALGDFKKAREIYERGIKIADGQGDVMPQRKMESRLRALTSSSQK